MKDVTALTFRNEQRLADALAELLVSLNYRNPRSEYLARRTAAMEAARALITDAEMERAEKLTIHPGDFDDLADYRPPVSTFPLTPAAREALRLSRSGGGDLV